MMKQWIGSLVLVFVAFAAQAKPMNVVFILADDLGWADTTLYGHTDYYKTPNLERLAKRGMTFNRAYANSPLCSPTRASILTGQTPARHGSTAPQHHLPEARLEAEPRPSAGPGEKAIQPHSASRLDTDFPTLGKMVKAAGYKTAHFGKWHLGPEPYSPLEHGFDIDIPHWHGPGPAGSFVSPWKYPNFKANFTGEHIEDRMAEEALSWLGSVRNKPFFMNYWQFSVHAPFDAKEELIEKYRKQINPDDPQRCPIYAAMVHSLDDAVGTLLDAIDEAGIAKQTIIVFSSDNGGNMYSDVEGVPPTSNEPLRGGKATMYEGGIRVPTVVVWPGITKPGSRCDEIIQTSDFYPTLLNALDIDLPKNWPIDGVDILPALKGGKLNRKVIFTYFPHDPPAPPDWMPPSIAVHAGDWKLIRQFHQGENGAHNYLLFNLADDLGEKNNLVASHPEKVKTLDRMIEEHIADCETVVPQPNPTFNPKQYRPELIGVPKAKQGEIGSVAGWTAGGTCSLEKGKGHLVVNSTGEDPFLSAIKFKELTGGPFTVHFRMKSDASGTGTIYYNNPAHKDRTEPFKVHHDGKYHEVRVELPVDNLNALRLDPARGAGTIEFDWIWLLNSSGEKVREWNF
jgi:arylsulfatase A-like enzyme